MGVPSHKLRGLVGQGMNGRRPPVRPNLYKMTDTRVVGAFSDAVLRNGWAAIFIWGAGGSGSSSTGGSKLGGGSGALLFRRVRVRAGAVIAGTIGAGGAAVTNATGNNGADTTVTYPDGLLGRAGGGGGGGVGGGLGTGGVARLSGDGSAAVQGNAATSATGASATSADAIMLGVPTDTGRVGSGGGTGVDTGGSSGAGDPGRVLIFYFEEN